MADEKSASGTPSNRKPGKNASFPNEKDEDRSAIAPSRSTPVARPDHNRSPSLGTTKPQPGGRILQPNGSGALPHPKPR